MDPLPRISEKYFKYSGPQDFQPAFFNGHNKTKTKIVNLIFFFFGRKKMNWIFGQNYIFGTVYVKTQKMMFLDLFSVQKL